MRYEIRVLLVQHFQGVCRFLICGYDDPDLIFGDLWRTCHGMYYQLISRAAESLLVAQRQLWVTSHKLDRILLEKIEIAMLIQAWPVSFVLV